MDEEHEEEEGKSRLRVDGEDAYLREGREEIRWSKNIREEIVGRLGARRGKE